MTITLEHIKHWYSLPTSVEKQDYYLEKVELSIPKIQEWHQQFKKYNATVRNYVYLCTFTKSPDNKTSDEKIEAYIIKQFKRPPLKVVEAHIVKEFTKNNVAHWHVAVETEKPLKKDRFNYYTKIHGFVDINKNMVTNIDTTLNYISKSGTPSQIK